MAKNYSVAFGSGDPRTYTGLSPTFLIFVRLTDGQTIAPPSISEALASSGIYTFSYGVTQPISFLIDAATSSPGAGGRYVTGQIDPADRSDEYGNTLVAYGLSMLAYGNTIAAIGTSHIAQGVTMIGLGGTAVAIGTNNGTTAIALGATLVAIGNTSITLGTSGNALGTTAVAIGTSHIAQGVTIIALGTTSVALGTTAVALGTTMVAIGLTVTSLGQSSALFSFMGSTASSIGSTSADPTTLFGFLMRAQELAEGNQTYTKATGVLDMFSRGATLLREKTIADNATTTTKS